MSSEYSLVIKPSKGWQAINFAELWSYRDLVFMLIKRDVYGKYRQSVLGFTWAFLPPLIQMIVFTFVFGGGVADLGPTDKKIPYAVFSFTALLPWTYFTRSLCNSSASVLGGRGLITKIYFPRLILPLTAVIGSLIDFLIGLSVLIILMLSFKITPGIAILSLPFFVFIACLAALGFGLWFTSLSVKYRDIGYVTPFLVQLWMFATPIIYAIERFPEKYHMLLWLNPMTGVVEGFRWALLDLPPPNWGLMGLSNAIVALVLVSGLFYFRTMEKTFVDII